MPTNESARSQSYFGDSFTAPGLPIFQRTITGHHDDGKAYFVGRDNGDKRTIRTVPGSVFEAAEANLYCTFGGKVDLNNDDDLIAAQIDWKVRAGSLAQTLAAIAVGTKI